MTTNKTNDLQKQFQVLRRMTTRCIKSYVTTKPWLTLVAGLSFDEKCRQLSWTLESEIPAELYDIGRPPWPVARHKSEVSSYTHYARAIIAVIRHVDPPDCLLDASPVDQVVTIGDDEEEILYNRAILWSGLCDLLPSNRIEQSSQGSSQLDHIESLLLRIIALLNERR